MIRGFACAETEKVFSGRMARRFPPQIQRTARRKLLQLHAAVSIQDLAVPPGNRLEALKGKWAGWHSVRINDQWRVYFRWQGSEADEVKIVDYH
jgi:proteic killer suppression protein